MKKNKGKLVTNGPLKGHYKIGRTFHPPLLSFPSVTLSDWVRDDLPDYLWPLLLVAVKHNDALSAIRKVQHLVIATIGKGTSEAEEINFDGRLTSIERVPVQHRQGLVEALTSSKLSEEIAPAELVAVLALYDPLPGAWLLRDPWLTSRNLIDHVTSANLLSQAVFDTISDRHRKALVNVSSFGWRAFLGKMSLPSDVDVIELLRNYPTDESKHLSADEFILKACLAFNAMDLADVAVATDRNSWAISFWSQNWHLFPCSPEELIMEIEQVRGDIDLNLQKSTSEASEISPSISVDSMTGPDDMERTNSDLALRRVVQLFDDFLGVALDQEKPVDLHNPAKHEVLCGLVSRAARSVVAILRAPHQWSGEHSSNTMRLLVETIIVITWMNTQDSDIYLRYQSYGSGKEKLIHKQFRDLVDNLPEDRPALIDEALQHLVRKTGGELGEMFQTVSLESNFAGISIYQMAGEAGLSDLYRYTYPSNSGVIHGEWWSIEDYAMQPCANPLHLFHRIPSLNLEFPTTADFPNVVLVKLESLIAIALQSLFGSSN